MANQETSFLHPPTLSLLYGEGERDPDRGHHRAHGSAPLHPTTKGLSVDSSNRGNAIFRTGSEVSFARINRRLTLLICLVVVLLLVSPGGTGITAQDADPLPPELPATYALVAENEQFRLYVDATSLAFKVLDKRSGYLWHSGLDTLAEGDRLNKSWAAFALSGISIEYLDDKAINKRVSITNSTTRVEITPVEQGVSAQVTFDEYGISAGVILTLEADGVRVEIPFTSIHENDPKFRLGQLYVYPFLGAARGSTIPGYMLLPDGSGSLIRFGDTTKAKTMFYGRYYGDDLGMISYMPWDPYIQSPNPISVPVYGMVHGEGENAYLAVVEQGAAYGELQVHPAGIITNFNFLYNSFIYSETYFQATNRSGAGVTIVQKQPNTFDAVVHYRFLTGEAANYVGMAQSYQQYLLERDQLHRGDFANPDIGIRLEFLGGDKEPVLFWSRFVPMTTLQQMSAILDGLQLPNPEVIYYGWQPFGASSVPPAGLSLDGGLGSVAELRDLAAKITAGGGHFSLYLDPQAALYGESGYSTRYDLAISITQVNQEAYNRNYSYVFRLDVLSERYTALQREVAAQPDIGLALDSIGWLLYSDFHEDHPLNREETIRAYQALLTDAPLRQGFYYPADYLFGQTAAYYDMPLRDNGYIYTTESVPFLPVVLAGYIPYYGGALNFSSDRQTDLLRHVEAGIYPSYFLTQEPTANMLNTQSAWIYSSSYAQWGEPIRETYAWLNALLAPVRGQEIIAHQQLADGVFATTYASGRQIIVNYTDHPFEYGGITVEAQNASLLESQS